MHALALHLDALRRRSKLSAAAIQRGFVRRGVDINISTVTRWFVTRSDRCTPGAGQLHILLDILGATPEERVETLRIAAEGLLASQADVTAPAA